MPIIPPPSEPPPRPTDAAGKSGDGVNAKAMPNRTHSTWMIAAVAGVCCGIGGGGYWFMQGSSADDTVTRSPPPAAAQADAAADPTSSSQAAAPTVAATMSLRDFDGKLQAIALRWDSATRTAERVRKAQVARQIRMTNDADDQNDKDDQLRIFASTIDDGLEMIDHDRDLVIEMFLELVAAWRIDPPVYGEQFDLSVQTLRDADRNREYDLLMTLFADIDDLPQQREEVRQVVTDRWNHSYPWPKASTQGTDDS